MSSRQNEIINTQQFLKSQCMNVFDEWIEGCIEYFCNETPGKRYSVQELNNMVKSQWLLGDLRDICPGCLPPNLNTSLKTSLPGIYVLQINFVVDVGVPAYQQLQKISKVDTTNIDLTSNNNNQSNFPEPTSQRMLKLSLTDGIQEVHGIEYKPMRNLSVDLTPGTKLKIKGPIDCRRGLFMLEEKHVTVLGGEVDILLENNFKNILTKIVNSYSQKNPQNAPHISSFNREASRFTANRANTNVGQPKNSNIKVSNATNIRNNIPSRTNIKTLEEEEIMNLNADMFEDDEFYIDQINAIEQQAMNPETPKFASKKIKISNNSGEFAVRKLSPNTDETIKCFASTSHANSRHDNVFESNEEEEYLKLAEMDDFAEYYDEPPLPENFSPVKKYDTCSVQNVNKPKKLSYPIEIDSNPFLYLKQLCEIPVERLLNKKFRVKVQIISLNSKLTFKNNLWNLSCKLCDGTAFLNVNIDSDLLSAMFGYTALETSKMKKEMESNPQLKRKFCQALSDAKEILQRKCCLMDIEYTSTGPVVVNMVDFDDGHFHQLKQRIDYAKSYQ